MKEHSQEWLCHRKPKNVRLGSRPQQRSKTKNQSFALGVMEFGSYSGRTEVVRLILIRAGNLRCGRGHGRRVREGGAGYHCWDPWKWRAAEREWRVGFRLFSEELCREEYKGRWKLRPARWSAGGVFLLHRISGRGNRRRQACSMRRDPRD